MIEWILTNLLEYPFKKKLATSKYSFPALFGIPYLSNLKEGK